MYAAGRKGGGQSRRTEAVQGTVAMISAPEMAKTSTVTGVRKLRPATIAAGGPALMSRRDSRNSMPDDPPDGVARFRRRSWILLRGGSLAGVSRALWEAGVPFSLGGWPGGAPGAACFLNGLCMSIPTAVALSFLGLLLSLRRAVRFKPFSRQELRIATGSFCVGGRSVRVSRARFRTGFHRLCEATPYKAAFMTFRPPIGRPWAARSPCHAPPSFVPSI
jgi:hypothetical protein